MKEITQRKKFNILKKKGIKKIVRVPDSTMKHFIDEGLKKEKSSVRSIRIDITPPNIKTRFMKSLK